MCLLTNERYKTYQTGFSFLRLGHAPGVGLGGTPGLGGGQNLFYPKFNQISCVSYLHEWHMQQHRFWVPLAMTQGWDLGGTMGGWGGGGGPIFFSRNSTRFGV